MKLLIVERNFMKDPTNADFLFIATAILLIGALQNFLLYLPFDCFELVLLDIPLTVLIIRFS